MNSYLRQQAEVLLAMSRQTIDLGMAGRLRKLAADFHERARAFERYDGLNIEADQSRERRSSLHPID